MSMIFKFRMLSDESDNFSRDYEFLHDTTLFDFHTYIRRDMKYNPCELASFFKSDVDWEKFQEFTLIDMDSDEVFHDPDETAKAPKLMSDIKLSSIITEKFDRLIYVFDMLMEREFYIELLESKTEEAGATYPRTVESKGNPPEQFIEPDDEHKELIMNIEAER